MITPDHQVHQSELDVSVDSLRDEVRVLREVLDEIREALQWQNNNADDYPDLVENREKFWRSVELPSPSRSDNCSAYPAEKATLSATSPYSDLQLPGRELLSEVLHGEYFDLLPTIPAGSVDCVFIDPPYNIGIDYGCGSQADQLPAGEYLQRMERLSRMCVERLTPTGALWFLCPERWADDIGTMLSTLLPRRNRIIWRETFGQYRDSSFPSGHRHLFYHVMDPQHSPFIAEEIRVPSQRMLAGDKRAAGPRVPDDVWEIPRLVGNAGERIAGHPCQLPEALLERIVLCSTKPGDMVLDPTAGTGTTLRVAQTLGRRYLGIEKEERFVSLIKQRLARERQHQMFLQ